MAISFKTLDGRSIKLPMFFPDATRAVVKTLDSVDIKNTKTPGVLVNTYHLWKDVGFDVVNAFSGVRDFMGWQGATISDSGGFQVMSLVKKKNAGRVTDEGVEFKDEKGAKSLLTPEESIRFQLSLKTDLCVVLDDFTPPTATREEATLSVDRTIAWAKRTKYTFGKHKGKKPYLIAVVQGGKYQDLREKCIKELVDIGFDGLGFGGWPILENGHFDYETANTIARLAPKNYLLYALGIGKPEDVVGCARLGFTIFDCVLPTRDARHGRLYVYNASSVDAIDITKKGFYSYLVPDKSIYKNDISPVSKACDCHLCVNYSKAYLHHLFKVNDMTAYRLASIHNLRFYSILMEKLRDSV